jgi:transposase
MGSHWAAVAQEPARGRRTDDRRVISGIVHVLKTGCRWQDCPVVYGPSTTVYNRFRRWTMRWTVGRADARRCWRWSSHRQHDRQGPPLGGGRKRGRRRRRLAAREARTTKIHAVVDARGRPIAIEVTPGHLGDVRVATAANQRRSARRAPGRRHRIRQRWSAALSSRTRYGSRHPEQSDPQATSSFRRDRLSPTQSHRAHVLPPQGLETHRHPLRQARSQLRRRHHDRGLIESGA